MKGFGDNTSLNSDKLNHPKKKKDLVLRNKLDFAKSCLIKGDVSQAEKIYSQLIKESQKKEFFFFYFLRQSFSFFFLPVDERFSQVFLNLIYF